ncbi:OsmC family protein [Nocardioides sp. BP30]|uniref:OsmC family protein n=1 Tax=Nocardioides sp. BP30 TaxID=3036374 RepID=UPI002468CBE5|nr:OsmC family protein [Nocardioides sp. BP30]WGL50595.1 OsmC family protein [Nocardioides sp. BP30]
MSDATSGDRRSIDLQKVGEHLFQATNGRGGVVSVGMADGVDFSPVELLLAGLAACGALDLDFITGKRAPFETFAARSSGDVVRDENGNHVVNLQVTFDVTFPAGEGGDAARAVVPATLDRIRDRLCTVGRTVQLGAPVAYVEGALD